MSGKTKVLAEKEWRKLLFGVICDTCIYMENEIVCVTKHSENILLFVKKGDEDNENNPMALQVNLENHEFYIDRIGRFLKFTPFVQAEKENGYYLDSLAKYFSENEIKAMIAGLGKGNI